MKVCLVDHNSVLKDLEKEFKVVPFDEADAIIIWNDVNMIERHLIDYARKHGKKVYAYQHGRKGTSKYYKPFFEKITSDKLFVWGEFDKQALLEAGQDEGRIKVVGATVLSHIKPKIKHEGKNIVFCPEHWDRPVEENYQVRDELRKLRGINIITKIIESHNPAEFDNPIQTNRDDEGHLDKCIEVLQTADLVVGISESTFELLAQAMDIPVVIVEEWEPKAFGGDMRYTDYRRVISRGSKRARLHTLQAVIKQELENPSAKSEDRKQAVIDEGGLGLDTIGLIKKEIQK